MRGFVKLTWMQAKLYVREPAGFFFTLVFPTLLLVVFGAIFGNKPGGPFTPGFGYIDTEVPGLAGMIIGSVALMGIPISTATAREKGVLRRFRATPLSPAAYLASEVLVEFGMALAGVLLLVAVGRAFFGLRFGGHALEVLAGFVLAGPRPQPAESCRRRCFRAAVYRTPCNRTPAGSESAGAPRSERR